MLLSFKDLFKLLRVSNLNDMHIVRKSRGIVAGAAAAFAVIQTLAAESPQVSRVQGSGEIVTVWGSGFDPSVEVISWSVPFDAESARLAVEEYPNPGDQCSQLKPPTGANRVKVLQRDERGLTMSLFFPSGLFHQPHFLVAKTSAGVSRAIRLGGAKPWMVFPERVHVSGLVRVFGVDLARRLVALRKRPEGTITLVDLAKEPSQARNSSYELDFRLPDEIGVGEYDLLVHNGRGGAFGWSRPLSLTVLPPPDPVASVIDARDFGAVGDGMKDDSEAIRAALLAAQQTGSPLHLRPGRYAISKSLWIPEGVEVRGAGQDQTTLFVREDAPMRGEVPPEIAEEMPFHFRERQKGGLSAMVWMKNRSTLRDLTLEDGPGVLQGVYVAPIGVRIESCRLLMKRSPQPAITVEWGSYQFVLRDCEITAQASGLFMTHGPNVQAYIGYNIIRPYRHGYPLQAADNIVIRGPERSLIEENDLAWGDRNLCFQTSGGSSSSLHTVVLGNRLSHGLPRRHNAGEFMIESGEFAWMGHAESATDVTISAVGNPLDAAHKWRPFKRHPDIPGQTRSVVVILDGRGVGQYRHLVDHNDKTVTVDRPWDVVPDQTSYFAVGRGYVENLWIDNTDEGTANWSGFWGVNIGHVVDGLIHRRGMGFLLWPYSASSATAFNEIRNSWFSERGNIVIKGPGLAFGNTISQNEIAGFFYRPSQHADRIWAHPTDLRVESARGEVVHRAGVEILDGSLPEGVPATLPVRAWNVINRNLIVDGPSGVFLGEKAIHTVLNRNVISVTGSPFIDEGRDNLELRSFSRNEKPLPAPEPVQLSHTGKTLHAKVGSLNLAAGRPVVSSSGIDPSLSSGFTDGSVEEDVAGSGGTEYLLVDLGESTALARIQLWHHYRDQRSYNGVIVQISDDPSFTRGVVTLFNNDADNAAGQGPGGDPRYFESIDGLTIDFPPTNARFIRCWLNGSDQNMFNHWREVKAFAPKNGKP